MNTNACISCMILMVVVCNYPRRYGSYLIPGLSVQVVTVRGIDICYCDRPSSSPDQPTLVFVHGFTSSKLSWFPVIKSLPKSWRIVALDLPGHGLSGFKENAGYNVAGMDKILHKVREKERREREGEREKERERCILYVTLCLHNMCFLCMQCKLISYTSQCNSSVCISQYLILYFPTRLVNSLVQNHFTG